MARYTRERARPFYIALVEKKSRTHKRRRLIIIASNGHRAYLRYFFLFFSAPLSVSRSRAAILVTHSVARARVRKSWIATGELYIPRKSGYLYLRAKRRSALLFFHPIINIQRISISSISVINSLSERFNSFNSRQLPGRRF